MFFMRLKTFLKSLLWHISRGLPKSSQNLINQRYEICLNCENFDKKQQQCLICGCNINRKKVFLNKLAWADQKCPINKW
jgi:hypothetical protein